MAMSNLFRSRARQLQHPVNSNSEGEKWIVRIPLMPRLAFPEEKMRGEIATMKYVSEKTKIPVPRIICYSIGYNNILSLPFMLLEYIEGQPLSTQFEFLDDGRKEHVYRQLSCIYLELFQQQFNAIGALTLDEKDEHWVFRANRPLTIAINDQEIGGFDVNRFLPRHQVFKSTIDYVYMLLKAIFNDFHTRRDCIWDEEDAQCYLYSLYAAQGVVMEWVKPEYNHGPFILMHGDIRPSNIIVDDNLNILSVLDWEWSHTVPAQLFVAPSWLTNEELISVSKDPTNISVEIANFRRAMQSKECCDYNPNKLRSSALPLTRLWRSSHKRNPFFLAHGLLKPWYFSHVFLDVLDLDYYGVNRAERINSFYNLDIRKLATETVLRKVKELDTFREELKKLGIEEEQPVEVSTALSSGQQRRLRKFRKQKEELPFKAEPKPEIRQPPVQRWRQCYSKPVKSNVVLEVLRWSMISVITAVSVSYVVAKLRRA
ncbi:hypothetical protein PRK78_006364 [Emydomyces testavorans]|uniref:Aminoglycoside phosphotransferase domain-containing protein n=1 Tax=Emydomyces testavorans TaxID=2070801 RepID=A0AAF0DP12_9EURO|nr:hypothetical protein PRK78_006364 [Emydomyces testavorans]